MNLFVMSRARLGVTLSILGVLMVAGSVLASGTVNVFGAGIPVAAVTAMVDVTDDPPVYAVDTEESRLSLTINAADGGTEELSAILALLNENGARATFFLTGAWARAHPDLARLIAKNGHELASHGMKHRDMPRVSSADKADEIDAANDVFESVTGAKPALFRAPSGAWDKESCTLARARGMQMIQWNVDSLDWKGGGREAIVSRVSPGLKPGAIVLFHVNAKDVLPALADVLETMKARSLQSVTVSELLLPAPYAIDHRGVMRASP